jgi:Short C-terminal domain
MVIAADYPFLDIVFTMIIFFAWVVSAAEIQKAAQLVERGAISQTEFEAIKAKALA